MATIYGLKENSREGPTVSFAIRRIIGDIKHENDRRPIYGSDIEVNEGDFEPKKNADKYSIIADELKETDSNLTEIIAAEIASFDEINIDGFDELSHIGEASQSLTIGEKLLFGSYGLE